MATKPTTQEIGMPTTLESSHEPVSAKTLLYTPQ